MKLSGYFWRGLFLGVATTGLIALAATVLSSCTQREDSTKEVPTVSVKQQQKDSGEIRTKKVRTLHPKMERTVFLYGEVGSDALALAKRIKELGDESHDPIYLLINSPGGSVLHGAMVISAIEASPAPVYTVCMQLCASMAAMIFEYGNKRLAVDRSFIMFHPAAGGAEGEMDKMVSRLGSIQRYINKMEAYVAKRAGISFDKYKSLSGVELWIDGEDATNTGFADGLVSIVADEPAQFSFGGKIDSSPNKVTLKPWTVDGLPTSWQ